MPPISHWTTVGFCNGCPGGAARSMSQGLRVLVYVLLKRKMLMQAGWPRQALLITVVRDEQGDGHAVLTVKTDKGEFILDNQNEDVLLWSETGYRFVKRQSQDDPNVWIALGDPRPATATATSR